jgi:hypothetical protein
MNQIRRKSMSRGTTNNKLLYLVAVLVLVIAFLLLGGRPWLNGIMHNQRSLGLDSLNWIQILISLGVGFVLGVLYSRRRKW